MLDRAVTGSGKPAAFLLPILHRTHRKPRGTTRARILSPTREVAAQIADDLAGPPHPDYRDRGVRGGGHGPQVKALGAVWTWSSRLPDGGSTISAAATRRSAGWSANRVFKVDTACARLVSGLGQPTCGAGEAPHAVRTGQSSFESFTTKAS